MNKKEFAQLQKDNIKSREQFLDSFPEHRKEMELALIEKEKEYGMLIGVASITLPNERFCFVEKYKSSYVISFGTGDNEPKTVRLSYEGFYAFGLLWNGFRTDEDAKQFFEVLKQAEKEK